MGLLLSKLLPIFVYPLGLTLLLLLVALCFALFRRRGVAFALVVFAVGYLWLASTPRVATLLYAQLEQQYAAIPVEQSPAADAIIVLGGIMGQALPPRVTPELAASVDRIVAAARLYRAGKARKVIVAAGNLPWEQTTQPEAVLIRSMLVEWGVDEDDILLDTASRNSRENAINAKALLDEAGLKTALLVTSAFHIPRAVAVFRKAGVSVIAFPTDISVVHSQQTTIFDWLPDAAALEMTTRAIKEWLGTRVYRWRGWIE